MENTQLLSHYVEINKSLQKTMGNATVHRLYTVLVQSPINKTLMSV